MYTCWTGIELDQHAGAKHHLCAESIPIPGRPLPASWIWWLIVCVGLAGSDVWSNTILCAAVMVSFWMRLIIKFKLIFKFYHNTCVISPDSFRCVLFKHLHFRYLIGISKLMSWFCFLNLLYPGIFLSVNRPTIHLANIKLRGLRRCCCFMHTPCQVHIASSLHNTFQIQLFITFTTATLI